MDEETQTAEKAAGETGGGMTGTNKLLLMLVGLVGVAFLGQFAAQKFVNKATPTPTPITAPDIFEPVKVSVPEKYRGNPYTNPEPFNITSFYTSMEILNDSGGFTKGSMSRENQGTIEEITVDEKSKVLKFIITDEEGHRLNFEYTDRIYDLVKIDSIGVDTSPTLTSLVAGDQIKIVDEYNTRAKDYETSVLSVTIIRL